jgi:adenylate cyclase
MSKLEEIERKFLVQLDKIPALNNGKVITQGYVGSDRINTTRVRTAGETGYIAIKGPKNEEGVSGFEAEYKIPVSDAKAIMKEVCSGNIYKTRYYFPVRGGHTWEVDFFEGDNAGLVIAEIELGSEDETFVSLEWIAEEVTGDPKYYNSSLIDHPYKDWK